MNNMKRKERERIVREEEIIDAAVKVFGKKGFDSSSMDEIALEAQFTKRTLYLYFENKEELFFAAAIKGFKKIFELLEKYSENEQTGFAKLVQGSKGYYCFYKDFPEMMRLIGEIGQVKKKAGEESRRLKDLIQIDNKLFQWVTRVIREGINDESIREDVNAVKAAFSIIFMMTGFFNQLSVTGKTFTEFFDLESEDFCSYSMNLLFYSIKK